jgi:fructokinase
LATRTDAFAGAFFERTLVLILSIGEILFDIFPEGRRLGGAAFNFAYHIHRLDGPVRFLSRIGQDPEGQAILDFLAERQFPPDDLQRDPDHPTGRVLVTLDAGGGARFDILPGVAYDFITATPSLAQFVKDDCELIYFGSLIQRTAQGAQTVRRILGLRSSRTKCLCDINLRPGCFSADSLTYSLREADVLKINDEELSTLASIHAIRGDTTQTVAALMARFDIEMVALTRAEHGSSLFAEGERYDIAPERGLRIKDTVGAGDAFAAMLAIGYVRRWPPERILKSASRLASQVCGITGAIPSTPLFYDRIRELLTDGGDHGE